MVLKEVPTSVAANPRVEVGSSVARIAIYNCHLYIRVGFLSFPGRSLNFSIKNPM